MPRLTQFEQQLLAILRENSRTPVSSIAEQLGVTRTTVSRAMAKLESTGTIAGYTIKTREDAHPSTVRAITCIELENSTTQKVVAQLRGIPEIAAMHTTNGSWDLVIELNCEDLTHFDRALRKIRETRGIVGSQTSILLSSTVF